VLNDTVLFDLNRGMFSLFQFDLFFLAVRFDPFKRLKIKKLIFLIRKNYFFTLIQVGRRLYEPRLRTSTAVEMAKLGNLKINY
jgi:hypothetical protein